MKKFKVIGILLNRKFQFISAVLLGIAIGIISAALNWKIVISLIIATLIYEIIIYYAYILLNIEMRRAVYKLNMECEAEEYLLTINNMLKYLKTPKSIRNWILQNKTVGLSAIGDFDGAINILNQIELKNIVQKTLYYNNMASYYISKFLFQDKEETFIELAEENLNQLLNIIDDKKINEKNRENLKKSYKSNKIFLNICKQKYESCIKEIDELLLSEQTPRGKSFLEFEEGYCYYMTNHKQQAKEHFQYVIDNGKEIYIAQQAKRYMEKISN